MITNISNLTWENGKYMVMRNGDKFFALRYDQPGGDLTGDDLIAALVQHIEELEDELEKHVEGSNK